MGRINTNTVTEICFVNDWFLFYSKLPKLTRTEKKLSNETMSLLNFSDLVAGLETTVSTRNKLSTTYLIEVENF